MEESEAKSKHTPDLLSALEFAIENMEMAVGLLDGYGHVTSLPSSIAKARAAIAKARLHGCGDNTHNRKESL